MNSRAGDTLKPSHMSQAAFIGSVLLRNWTRFHICTEICLTKYDPNLRLIIKILLLICCSKTLCLFFYLNVSSENSQEQTRFHLSLPVASAFLV